MDRVRFDNILYIIFLSIIIFIGFSPALKGDFLAWHDGQHLNSNPHVYSLSIPSITAIFQTSVHESFIPLTVLSFSIEHFFFGLKPFVYHFNNILLHILVCVFIYRIGLKLTLSARASLVTSLLFGLHPLHVESVAWISSRKDVLYALFYVWSISQYLDYQQDQNRKNYYLSLLFGFLSILANPLALSLPLILLLFDWLNSRKISQQVIIEKIPYLFIALTIAFISFILVSRPSLPLSFDALLLFIYSFSFYIKKFFWPFGLIPLYSIPQPISLSNVTYLLSLVIFIAFWGLLYFFRSKRWFVFAGLFYVLSTFFFWQNKLSDTQFVADHLMYLPSLGLCLWIGFLFDHIEWSLEKMGKISKAILLIAITFLFAGLGFLTVHQSRIWQNDLSLWEATINVEAHNRLAQQKIKSLPVNNSADFDFAEFNKGFENNASDPQNYLKRGLDLMEAGYTRLALADFNRALKIDPQLAEGYLHRGQIYILRDNEKVAMKNFDKALKIKSDLSEAILGKGMIYAKKGDLETALELFNQAIESNPHAPENFLERSKLFQKKKKFDLALTDLNRVLEMNPSNPDALYNRAKIFSAQKNWNQATDDYKRLIDLEPRSAKNYNELGVLYLNQKDVSQAREYFSKAISFDPFLLSAYNNRGMIYKMQKQFDLALNDLSKVIEIDPEFSKAYIARADIYLSLKNYAEAYRDFTSAIRLAPKDPMAYIKRAYFYALSRKSSLALKDLNKALKLSPQHPLALELKNKISRKKN